MCSVATRVSTRGVWLVLAVLASVAAAGRESSLVDAVKKGDAQVVRALVKAHADVNGSEPDGTTPLHWAVNNDDLETVELLIRAGANVAAANRYGVTPLAIACANGTPAVIER